VKFPAWWGVQRFGTVPLADLMQAGKIMLESSALRHVGAEYVLWHLEKSAAGRFQLKGLICTRS
jgi:hypothetical protein